MGRHCDVCLYVVATNGTLCVVDPPGIAAIRRRKAGGLPLQSEGGRGVCWTTRDGRAALWIAFLANLTAYPLTTVLPYMRARSTAPTRPGSLSVASFAVGSLVGSIVLSLVAASAVAR